MPKKPGVDKDSVLAILSASKEAVLRNGNIAKPSDNIWSELSHELGDRISPKGLYTLVKQNRHNSWSVLGLNTGEESDTSEDSLVSGESNTDEPADQTFKISVPFNEWVNFMPQRVTYADRNTERQYHILRPGAWTHVINAHLWKKIKSTCTFVFKRAKVYPTATTKYVDIKAYCKECQGQLHMQCREEPAIQCPMHFDCDLKNQDASLHTGLSKRSLSGELRKDVAKDLCEGKLEPNVWRTMQASEMMDFGDPEPSHLPNLATLRKAKEERNAKELPNNNPLTSLQILKYSPPHSGSIKDIGLDKFFCHYWSQTQMHVYKAISKKSCTILCFDATGSVVRKLSRPNGNSGHIFLYQGVMTGQNISSVPVVQMLSERHDVNAISHWLTEWIRAGAPVPKEVVSDFSLAILGAMVKSFTPHPDLKAYLNECFSVMLGKQSAKLPPCFIRVDVAHCIKMICQWDCLKKKSHRVKDFFVRSLAQVIKSVSLDHAKELLLGITVVALSEGEGNDSSGLPVASERYKKYLKSHIAEENIMMPEDDTNPNPHPEQQKLPDLQTDLRQWVEDICEEGSSRATAKGDRDNIHFLPEIIPHIKRLVSTLPLWSAVMVPHFKSSSLTASSATVEAEFKNIKHGLYKHESLPMRVDRFISRHLTFIEGKMRLCSAKNREEESTATDDIQGSCNKRTAKDADFSPNDDVENWRGLGVPPKKRKRHSYLSSCPEWLNASPSVNKTVKIGLLRNGNHQQPVRLRHTTLSVLNTCAIDAFCQSLSSTFADSSSFQRVVNGDSSSNLLQLVKTLSTEGVSSKTYMKRAEVLATLFSSVQLKSGALQIDAKCHISTIIQKTMRNIASVYWYKQCSSPHCTLTTPTMREVPIVSPSFDTLQAGMAHLETAVLQGLNLPSSPCLRPVHSDSRALQSHPAHKREQTVLCTGMVTHRYSLGNLLWVDTDLHGTSTTQPQHREFALSEFPSFVVLQGKTFNLRAIIAFRGGLSKDAVGHYVCYSRRAPFVWEMYDDLGTEVKTAAEKTLLCPHAVLFTHDH